MKKKIKFTLFIGLVLIFLVEAYVSNNEIEVTNYEIEHSKIPREFDGFKIVQLSDFHDKIFHNNNVDFVAQIKKQTPDIIVMTGDMITVGDKDFSPFFSLCWQLRDICPVYYIAGNHEECLWSYGKEKFMSEAEKHGIHVLENETIPIAIRDAQINLTGLDLSFHYYHMRSKPTMKLSTDDMGELLGKSDKHKYDILLAHTPNFFSEYVSWGADLILCGHIHGGIIRIGNLAGLLSPDRVFFPKYDAGMFTMGEQDMIVSRGLSNSNIIPRMFNKPEIVVVTLKSV